MSNHPKPFSPDQFTHAQCGSPQDKADFGNNLVAFILGGYKFADFTDALYKRLSMTFGHIAHYDRRGFYSEWFSDGNSILQWIDYIRNYTPLGSAEWTFSDLEREFKGWIERNLPTLMEHLQDKADQEEQTAEAAGSSVEFKVIAISLNTGPFGHRQHILIGRNAVMVKGDRQPSMHNPTLEDLKEGDILTFEVDANGSPINWNSNGFEFMDTHPDEVPEKVMAEAWPAESAA